MSASIWYPSCHCVGSWNQHHFALHICHFLAAEVLVQTDGACERQKKRAAAWNIPKSLNIFRHRWIANPVIYIYIYNLEWIWMMENDVAWYSHCTTKKLRHRRPELLWRRGWPWPRMDPVVWCEPVDPVGRVRPVPKCAKSCWVCWLQATIHKIETSYPASSPARWGNNKWTSFYHDFSYPARECEPGFSAEEMKLSNGSERGCATLSAWFHWSGRLSLPRWQKWSDMDAEARIMITLHKKVWVAASA